MGGQKEEILKWLNAEIIYPISDSQWVSLVHVVPKKAGVTVTTNEKGEEIQTRLPTKWRVCIDYRKLNSASKKDHFPLPFIDQILDRLARSTYFCFLDGYLGYNQIAIHLDDQEKTTFTCPFGTFAFRRMPFGLCNAPATFQRCMTTIFSDFLGDNLEVFMEDFSIFGNNFESCLAHLTKILEVCIRKRLVLNWEKSHFMVREGVVLKAHCLKQRLRSGQGQDRGHPKPHSSKYCERFEELSRARQLLSKIHLGLRESIQAPHHPSL